MKEKLLTLFKNIENLKTFVTYIEMDRLTNSNKTFEFLNELLEDYLGNTKIDEKLAESDPLLFILLTIIVEHNQNDVDSTCLRNKAADAYMAKYTDERFERNYFYSRSPIPILSHLLLITKIWENVYDDQMMGIYKGTVAYNENEIISKETVELIQKKESEINKGWPYPFSGALEKQHNGTYKVIKWCSTPVMDKGIDDRLDRLFTAARRIKHKEVIEDYKHALHVTSQTLHNQFPNPDQGAFVIIGPYGSGKTTYLTKNFGVVEDKSLLVSLSADTLNNRMRSREDRASRSDFHFEAAILRDAIDNSKVKILFATGAYVDSFRFDQMLDKTYLDRNIHIIEIAPERSEHAVLRLCRREKITETTGTTFAQSLKTANTAQNSRMSRINKIKDHKTKYNVEYKLICNKQTETGAPNFVEVCTVKNGKLEIQNQELYTSLTQEYLVKEDDIKKLLQPLKQQENYLSSPDVMQ